MPASVDDEVAAPQHRRRQQEPAHGVGAVRVEHLVRVGVVAQALGHLLAVVAEQDAVADAGPERRPVEQRRGQHVQRVEPAAGLADVLDDEVARVVVLEPLLRSRTGSAPGRTASSRTRTSSRAPRARAASSTARSGRPGWAGRARRPSGRCRSVGPHAEVRARARRGCRRRRRAGSAGSSLFHTGIGEPQNRLRLIDQSRALASHLPKRAVLDVLGHPGDLLVELDHAVPERRSPRTNQDDTAL